MKNDKKKISGMLYIFFSFIPWIVYWTLCGVGKETEIIILNALGIIIPFVVSLSLVAFQIRKKDFNLMDIVSAFYFGIATIGTFILNSNIFIEKNGFLGYFVLFLMALFSLLIKQPYTLQVSKKDYPEFFWKDKLFLTINNIIAIVWSGIFLLNAIIFLFFTFPLTVIFSNILIGFGIVFSIIFPLKAPAYFISKEFKKYDWKVEVNPQKQKDENEYDVIIVGSGIGGLTCGALLSKRGYKVLILEQHYQVGGYCTSFKRGAFTFTTGVEDVSGLWEKGPINFLLKELGFKKDDLFVKNTKEYILKDKRIKEPVNLEEFPDLLSKIFPSEKENIQAFFCEVQKVYEEEYRDAEIFGTPLPSELIVKAFGEKKIANFPKEKSNFYDWMETGKIYKQKLDEYFKDEDLKQLLSVYSPHIGVTPDKAFTKDVLGPCVSYFFYGGYFPKGGPQKFADSLKDYIENHNGKVLVNHLVDKILIKNNEVNGVKVRDQIFKSSIIVSNANAKNTFLKLIEKDSLNKKFVKNIKELKMAPSCFAVFLGVDMDLSNYSSHIIDVDEALWIVISSNVDSSLAPKGKANIILIGDANYSDFPERGTKEYLQKKKEITEILIKKAEKIIPDLSKHIIVQDAATPKTFERYTLTQEGAIYSFDQSIETKRPCFKTPIKGLYLVGASTFPGGGIEAVVMSGMICANDICDWKRL